MIVINSNMLSGDPPRLNLVTSSRDYIATVDYPLRPTVFRTWGKPLRPRSRWQCCYFPQSFPVYRMHRLISVVLCLLVMVLLSVIAFVLVQVVPPQQMDKTRSVPPVDTIENGVASEEDYRKRESGLGLVRTARKLEDHPEYKRSIEDADDEDDDDYVDDDEEDDDIILKSYDDNGEDEEDEYNPVFDMKYFDFSLKGKENGGDHKRETSVDKKDQNIASSSFRTPQIRQKWQNLPEADLMNSFKMKVIENGVVFSQAVEALLVEPELSDAKIGQIQEKLRSAEVNALQEPTWERCGRPKNQWLELSTGEGACARYRYPDDYLLVGEVLSFYLSRLLSVGHVPPVVLSQPTGTNWHKVEQEMQKAGWGDAPVVVLTPWFEGLVRDHMPSVLLETVMKNATLSILAEDKDTLEDIPDNKLKVYGENKLDTTYRRGKQSLERDLKEHKEPLKQEKAKDLAGSQNGMSSRSSAAPPVAPVVSPPTSKKLKELSKKAARNDKGLRKLHYVRDVVGSQNGVSPRSSAAPSVAPVVSPPASQKLQELSKKGARNDKGLRKLHYVRDVVQSQKAENPNAFSTSTKLKEMSERDLTQLLQWSDLLVFDYLTGNYDRVAYMQDAAEKEGRTQILSGTIHNLVRSKTTDALWLLDNESGLIDAYTLLYGTADPIQSKRFHEFHRQMLESICLFRRSTMEAILGLHLHPEPHVYLVDFVKRYEPLFHLLPDPLQNSFFVKYFPLRVKEVHDWMLKCITRVQGPSPAR